MNKLISLAIVLYIGTALIPGLQSIISGITVVAGYSVGVVGMAGVLLIIFMWGMIKMGIEG